MKTMHIVTFFMIFSLVIGCDIFGITSENDPPKELPLAGPTWWLEAFEDEHGVKSDTGPMRYDISFTDSTRAAGKTWGNGKKAANTYFVSYYTETVSIKITDLVSTLVGEPQGSKSTEYYIALQNATSYEIEGDRLFIFYGEQGNKTLHFQGR